MPASQVITFQAMAPDRAPKITRSSTMCGSTMPVPMVLATCRPNTAKAMKLKKAAQATAQRGGRARVETMVAIEFAASCSPFRKSNARATATSPIRTGVKLARDTGGPLPRTAQSCSIRMPLIWFATSSNRSITFSRWL